MYVFNLATALIERGHDATLLTRSIDWRARRYSIGSVPVVELRFFPTYPFHVHLHGGFVRHYLHRTASQYDVIHAHSPLVPPIHAEQPIVTTVHSLLAPDARSTKVEDFRSLLIRLQTPISVSLESRLIRGSAAVAVVNPGQVQEVGAKVDFAIPVRVHMNAVDVNRFTPGPTTRSGQEVLAVGRLVHGKGFDDLLVAWRSVVGTHPEAHLTVVGDGPLRGRLERLATELGIAQWVRFAGPIGTDDQEELIELYRTSRVAVQPSHHEGLSTVILEAMACSTAVVATTVGAHANVISDGYNGRLVPPRDPGALAAAIQDLLAFPGRTAELAQRGRETVVRSFDWGQVANGYATLYGEVLSERRRAD
jgi:glycosyltransferase involved in cell wall biosynthesis